MPNRIATLMLLLLTLTLLAAGGCDDDATTPDPDGTISGLVVDDQGRPVVGAAILISYDTSEKATAGDKAAFVFKFSLRTAAQVRIWISEGCHHQMIRTLADGIMSAGLHELVWDGDDAEGIRQVSGVYVVNLEVSGATETSEVLVNRKTYAQYLTAEGLDRFAETGEDGRFRIDQECLALGREVHAIAEDGSVELITVSRRATVWAIHEDFGAASHGGPVVVDPSNGAFVAISFGEASAVRSYAASHWSEDRLACAYDPSCTDPAVLVGLGALYFATDFYHNLPLWISQEDDEEEFLENIGRWMHFVFGWDDFVHPSVFMGDDFVFGDVAALNDPRISAHRETYRALLGMTKSGAAPVE